MKLILGLLITSNVFGMTDVDPKRMDISVSTLIDHYCGRSGYFNPAVCVDGISKCYDKIHWPKTVTVEMKISVVDKCFSALDF